MTSLWRGEVQAAALVGVAPPSALAVGTGAGSLGHNPRMAMSTLRVALIWMTAAKRIALIGNT